MGMNPNVKGYQYGGCRLLGHMWEVVPSDWTPQFGEPMTMRCERCGIERRDSLNRNSGGVETRRYVYPDGYLFVDLNGDTPRRDDFRLAWLDGEVKRLRATRHSE